MSDKLQTTPTEAVTMAGGAQELLAMATNAGSSIEVIERMAMLYEREREDVRRMEFSKEMTAAQLEMGRVKTDAKNSQTHSEYATYGAIDRVLRPIYTTHGFALSFDSTDSPSDGCVRVLCYVSHVSGYERTYHIDMPADGKGAKGGDVMTKTHATGAAISYGKRYLLNMIFNVALGDDDKDGNVQQPKAATVTAPQVKVIRGLLDKLDNGAEIEAKILASWGIARIEDIAAAAFDKLTARLGATIDKQNEEA